MIRFVVLSDIHMEESNSKICNSLDTIIGQLQHLTVFEKKIDYLIIAGDLTNSGKYKQFEEIKSKIENMKFLLDLNDDNVLIVPGNHDYDRNDVEKAYKDINIDNISKYRDFFHDKDYLKHGNRVFNNYLNFNREISGKSDDIRGFSLKKQISEQWVQFLCINSAFYSPVGNYSILPYIDPNFVEELIEKKDRMDLSILVMHHPINDLYPSNQIELKKIISQYFDIIISGHRHYSEFEINSIVNEDPVIQITNGFINLKRELNLENFPIRFTIFDYNFEKANLVIQPWKIDSFQNFCSRDTSLYSAANENGILNLFIANRAKKDNQNSEDPLKKKIPEQLFTFFQKRSDKLLKCKNLDELKKIIQEFKHEKLFKIEEISMFLLKFYIENARIRTYKELREIIETQFIFERISTDIENQILNYYDDQFFSEKYAHIETKISKRESYEEAIKLKLLLEEKNKEIEELKRNSVSFIEPYISLSEENLPKIMDSNEDEFKPQHLDWFLNIKLISDPFPSYNGLKNIDKNLIDEIIYETESIKHFKSIIINNPEILINKTLCIYGLMGSGKTTLFQYMQELLKIHQNHIQLINFSLESRNSYEELKKWFFIFLYRELEQLYRSIFEYIPDFRDEESGCLKILSDLSTSVEDIIIFVEDIYKPSISEENIEYIVKFINSIQIIQTNLNNSGVKISFIFSLVPELASKIKKKHSTSGSIDEFYEMTPISIKEAVDIINLRLKAFSIDKLNSPFITRNYIEKLKNIAKPFGIPVKTIRDYLELVKESFKRLEFDEDEITISYNQESLANLVIDLKNQPASLFDKLDSIKSKIKNRENFEKIINILEKIWIGGAINENAPLVQSNKTLFILLANQKLIERRDPSTLHWTLSKILFDYFQKIKNLYKIFPSSILPQMFFRDIKIPSDENKIQIIVQNLIDRSGEFGIKFQTNLKEFNEGYGVIYKYSLSLDITSENSIPQNIIELVFSSFMKLFVAFIIQSDCYVEEYEDALEKYEKSWYEDEDITGFILDLIEFKSNDQNHKGKQLVLLQKYLKNVNILVKKLKRQFQWDNIISLRDLNLLKSTKRWLNAIRRNVENGNYELAIEKINSKLPEKLSRFVYDYSLLLFGRKKWRRALPQSVNRTIKTLGSDSDYENWKILQKLEFNDFIKIFIHLDNNTNNLIEDLKNLREWIKTYLTKVKNKESNSNPCCLEMVKIVEFSDNFYEKLFNDQIITSFSNSKLSHIINIINLKEMKISDDFNLSKNYKLTFDLNSLDESTFDSDIIDIFLSIKKHNYVYIFDYKNEYFLLRNE